MKPVKESRSDEDQETALDEPETSDLKGDYKNVGILLFLYLLQGNKKRSELIVSLRFVPTIQEFLWASRVPFQFCCKIEEFLTPSKLDSRLHFIRSRVSVDVIGRNRFKVNYRLCLRIDSENIVGADC